MGVTVGRRTARNITHCLLPFGRWPEALWPASPPLPSAMPAEGQPPSGVRRHSYRRARLKEGTDPFAYVHCLLIVESSGAFFRRTTDYEMINQTAQLKELADGKARNLYDLHRTSRRIEHPAWHLERAAMRLPEEEIMNTVVLMVARHQDRLTSQRVERIGDHGFECQKPGTMAPARTRAPRVGQFWLR